MRGSSSTVIKRRARSSETDKPFPVSAMKADALRGTICDLPNSLTRAGRSVIALANRSDLKAVLLRLSRNSAGPPSINSAAIRFSNSSEFAPDVTACGSRPKAMAQIARTRSPLPAPAPDIGAARTSNPGARCRLGRQTAVNSPTRNADSSLPGAARCLRHRCPESHCGQYSVAKAERLEVFTKAAKRGSSLVFGRTTRNHAEVRDALAPHA